MKFIKQIFINLKNKFISLPKFLRILIIIAIVGGAGWFTYSKIKSSQKSQVSYKTTTVEKGTLVTSISATGTITSSNKTTITTGATGTIKKVYVKNGDSVTKGQKIADITLDDDGTYNQTVAWANYLTMKQNYQDAVTDQTTADIKMWNAHQTHLNALGTQTSMASNDTNPKTNTTYTETERAVINKTVTQAYQEFKSAELEYNNSSAFMAKSREQMSNAYDNYQKVSSTIYAPISGTISNLSLAEGVIISNSSTSITVSTGTNSSENSSSVTSHTVGSITNPKGQYQATLSLTESDIVKIKAGQKVTMTMDAFEDVTFTGEVLSVDVAGSTSSGVTSYSVVVLLDDTDKEIYTNMAVTATIIIDSQSDVLLIPSTAIDTANDGTSTVQLIKNGVISTVTVTLGSTNDSQTIITSGLSEGDTIVASSISNQSKSNNNTSSDFSSSSRSSSSTKSSSGGSSNFMMGAGGPPGM
jgi:macrolide-specific efflux system membrane fusion protein